MRNVAAHHAAVRLDGYELFKADSAENVVVGFEAFVVVVLKIFLSHVEAVGILHGEFSDSDKSAAATRLVAELGLNLINHKRQLRIAGNGVFHEMHGRFFVSHAEQHILAASVLEANHFAADGIISSAGFPHFLRHNHREFDFLSVELVHFVANDVFDVDAHKLSRAGQRIYTVCNGFDVAGSHQKSVAQNFYVGRRFLDSVAHKFAE